MIDHPQPDKAYLSRTYRSYLMGRKRKWMSLGRGHRCLRGLIYYRQYVALYLAGKCTAPNSSPTHPTPPGTPGANPRQPPRS